MFTGLIQKTAAVLSADPGADGLALTVATGFTDLKAGESIALNGVCLTVTEFTPTGDARFYLSTETRSRSAFDRAARPGAKLNLERALRAGDRLGGHWVQGHVDAVGSLSSCTPDGGAYRLEFSAPSTLAPYLVEKGSICVDGVSLTLNVVSAPHAPEARFQVMIIPHTWEQTTLSSLRVGDPVNLEADILAKYTERMLAWRPPTR